MEFTGDGDGFDMDVYAYAQTIRGVAKLHGSWVLSEKEALSKILTHLGKMDDRLQKLLDLSYALHLVENISKSDPDDWEDTLEHWSQYLVEHVSMGLEAAQQICVLWLASLRKLPSYAITSGMDGDVLHVWAEPPEGLSGGNLDSAIILADRKDVILLAKGNYQLPDLAISRGRNLLLRGDGELGDVIVEPEEGVYLLGNTALCCENLAFNTNRALDKSNLFQLHKDAKLTLRHCVLRSDGAGVVARDACALDIEDSKFACKECGVRLHNEAKNALEATELSDAQKVRCRVTKTDFFQCGSAIATHGSGFDLHILGCNINRSEGPALSFATQHSSVTVEKTAFSNNAKGAIELRGNAPTLRFHCADNVFKGAQEGQVSRIG